MKPSHQRYPLARRWATALTVGTTLVCSTASGQEEIDSLLEEIVVTAEFREASVQDTPLAVTAVSADMLEARSQTNLAQISSQAPNVSLRPAGSSFGNSLVAFIRGVGQTDFNPSVEPGVGIYVDDVYYSTITGNVLDLLDLDRVEILRGPQGTLAGRNAIGGAIKLFTRKPDGDDDGFVSLTYGDRDRVDVKAAGGFTLIPDKLFARVAGVSRSSDGYVTRYDFACVNGLPEPGTPGGLPRYNQTAGCKLGEEGGQSYTAGRLGLRWVVNDDFEVSFAASTTNDDSQSTPSLLVAAKDNSGSNFLWLSPNGPVTPPFASQASNNPTFSPLSGSTIPIFFDNNGNGTYEAGVDVPYDNRFVTDGTYTNYATYLDDGRSQPSPLFQGGTPGADSNVYKPYVIEPVNRLKSKDVSLSFNWQITDNVSLLSVSAYRTYKNDFAEDTDGSPLAVQQLLQVMDHEQKTQELRLNAALFDGFLDLTVGAFYLDQETNEDARVDLPYVGFDFIHGPDKVPSEAKALYSQFAFHPSDRLDVSIGMRYSEDEKSYTFQRHNPDGSDVQACTTFWFWEAGNPANCGVFGLNGESVANDTQPTHPPHPHSYDILDDTMLYGQIATGYKAGGNNARPFFPSQLYAFEPEELLTYEIGLKTEIASQLRLNTAVFVNDYTDIQLPTNECTWADPGQTTPCASQNNVGDADVWGVEIEGTWYLSEAATIDFSYAYLDFEYSEIALNPVTGVPLTAVTLDMVPPYTPETKWSIGAQYIIELGGGLGTLTPRIDVAFQDDIFSGAVNRPDDDPAFVGNDTNLIESYTLTNARVTWRSEDMVWQADLEVTNVTDEYYYTTLFDTWGANGYINGTPGHPREWALTLKRNF